MLEQFREFANNKIVRIVFVLFLAVPFGLFGIDYYFKAPVGGDAVANVGRSRIGSVEFDQALRQQADVYRQQLRGQFDASFMDNPEVRRSVLDRLVNERLMSLGAERAGVRVTDKQIAAKLAAEPIFASGFSAERYSQLAKAQGLTPAGLDERLREDYRQQQFRSSIIDTAIVPRATLDSFIRISEQTREVSAVNLAPEAYTAKVKVTPEQIKAFYDSHAPEFTIPERARVDYVEMSLDALAAKSSATPDEVKKVYEEEVKAGKHGTKEMRKASHILITVKPDAKEAEKKAAEARAQEIAARVRKSPSSFAEVARKESQDPGSAAQGGELPFFGRDEMTKPFEEAAFAAKKNEIVGPVATDYGYHVIRVTEIRPEKVKSLAEVAPQIEAALKKQAAAKTFAEMAEQFTNMVYEQSTSLKPAAEKLNLAVLQSPWISKGGSPIPLLNNPKLMAEMFSESAVKGNRNTAAIEVASNTLVAAHVLEHKPSELKPLDSVKADIERRLTRQEAMKLAREDGEAKLKELQAGKDAGLKWPAALAVNRQKPGGLFPPVLDKVFRVDPKKLPAYVGVETPVGYSVVKVSKVIELEKVDDEKRAALAPRLRDAVAAEEMESTLASLRGRVGVTVRKDALEKKSTQ